MRARTTEGIGAWHKYALLCLLGSLTLCTISPEGATAAAPKPLWQRCDGAAGDLSCRFPRGIGLSSTTGHLYVADQGNSRIDEYTAWGEFVRAWGWGVSNGAEELQVCSSAAICQAGIPGGGKGQLVLPQGIAVDSSGSIYVAEGDENNRRVQKFDTEGHFVVMFGGKVNKTKVEEAKPAAEQNRCPVDPGDVCQAASEGSGPGEFGAWVPGAFIATGPSPANLVYVGDKGRVQVFNPDGTFKENFPDPEGIIAAGGSVQSLAAAPANGLYLAFNGKANVTRLSAAGKVSAPGCVATVTKPRALAMAADATGKPIGNLYVFDEGQIDPLTSKSSAEARVFTAACVDKAEPFGRGEVNKESTGIAASSACLAGNAVDVYLSSSVFEGFVRAYGPAPDEAALCPKPLLAPEIVAEYATAVGTVEATLRAQINPRFYADTSFQLQYGTAACIEGGGWEAPCVNEQPPAPAPLGAEAVDFPATSPAVFLSGLSPATAYRYRFLAQSSGGGPVLGAERSFTTFASPVGLAPCPNEAFRISAAASLPDCRAYELVTPVDKEGGEILTLNDGQERPAALEQSSTSGDKLTYSSYVAFAEPESSPYTSQYIASRGAGSWESEAISPPRGTNFIKAGGSLNTPGNKREFEAFSDDLCRGWLVHDNTTAPPLAPDASPYNRNIYRRENCGAGSYEAVSKIAATTSAASMQGVSGDGERTIFRTEAHLSQAAPTAVGTVLKCESPTPITPSFQWLREGAPIAGATASQYTAQAADAGKTIQCRMTASNASGASVQDANPVWVIAPYPASAPPLAPQSIAAPSASAQLVVGGAGGQTLSCDPNAAGWGGSPSFAYQWYRNGVAIAGAETAEYAVQAADLTTAVFFQCEVIATNAGGKTAAVSAVLATSPEPEAPIARPNTATEEEVLYESDGEGGVHVVCILPGGAQSNGCSAGTENQLFSSTVTHALSDDGSRIVWTGSASGEGTIYLRLDGETTVQLTAGAARFWTAAADGSQAIVSSAGKLLEIDLADPEAPVTTQIAEGFKGVVGASDDASLLYFVSSKTLTGSEENSEEQTAQEEEPNLYLWRAGEGGETLSFVGTLAGADIPLSSIGAQGLSPVAVEPYEHAARTSADGKSVAFMSRASLTGYDNADAASGVADAEVFVYDAVAEELSCASCNPSGARPSGRVVTIESTTIPALPTAAQLPPIQSRLYTSHLLAEDGSRLFFESVDPLTLADTNGKIDVYEWEASAGSCTKGGPGYSSQNEGCLTLISSGKSPVDSRLLDASPSGRDVFFATGASLLPYDPGSIDIYDAREGGGFPLPPEPQPPCEGEACQSPPPAPAEVTPTSAAFSGEGNLAPRKRCAKGKRRVVRKGKERCVTPRKRCAKGKRRVVRKGKERCVKKHVKRKARHHRRATR